jgi:hypothetical protein
MLKSLKLPTDFDAVFVLDRVIHKEGLYISNMFNIVEKQFSIIIATRTKPGRVANM